MKNTSIFKGVKELNGHHFVDGGFFWDVYNELGVFVCWIKKTNGDSNKRLWEKFETQRKRMEDDDDGL
jgi:hypothetical protein